MKKYLHFGTHWPVKYFVRQEGCCRERITRKLHKKNADFLWENLFASQILRRTWRNGISRDKCFLEDYASLILAYLNLYQTDFKEKWLQRSLQISEQMVDLFVDDDNLINSTGKENEKLFVNINSDQDNATPSGLSLATYSLLIMSIFLLTLDGRKSQKKTWEP